MTKKTVADLLPNTNYAIQVRARAKDGRVSDWSSRKTFKTISDVVRPRQPGNFTLTPGNGFFEMEWDTVTENEDGTDAIIIRYEVEMRANGLTRHSHIPQSSDLRTSYILTYERAKAFFGGTVTTLQARVRAVNDADNASVWTSLLTVDLRKPDAPTDAVVESVIDGIKISWTPPANMTNVDGYKVYVSTSESFTANENNRVYRGVNPGFTYTTSTYMPHYFKIRSFSNFGLESDDLLATGEPKSPFGPDQEAPTVPTLTVSLNRTGAVAKADAAWTFDATAATNKDIQAFVIRWRKTGESDSSWRMEYFDKAARTGSIDLPQAFNNYEFQIGSIDFVANYSAWSPSVFINGAIPGPPPKTATPTVTSSLDGLNISWTASTAEDVVNGGKYRVQVATNSGFTTGLLEYLTGTTQIAVNGLSPATTYYVRVQAIDVANETGAYSDTVTKATTAFPVVELSDKVAPSSSPTPTTTGGIGYIYLSWSAITNNDPVIYEIHQSTTSGFTPAAGTKIGEVSGTSFIAENVSYGTTYYFRIIAKDRDGAANAGTQASGTPTKATITDLTLATNDIAALGFSTTTQMNTAITTSANGVNRNIWSTAAASGTTDGTRAYINGDTWMQRDASGNIIGEWEFVTNAWQPRKISHQTIASIDVGNMTVIGKLGAANIEATSLVIQPTQVDGLNTTLSGISTSLSGKTDNSTFSSTISGINTSLSGKATPADISTSIGNFNTATVQPGLNARPTTTTVDSQVAAAQSAATTAGSNAAQAALKTLWGGSPNSTTINGGVLANNTVLTSKLAVADFLNYIADAELADPNFGSWSGSGLTRTAASGTTPAYISWSAGNGSNAHIFNNYIFDAKAGDEFYFTCEVSTPSTNTVNLSLYGALQTRDAAGTVLTWPQLPPTVLAPNTGWTTVSGTIKITGAATAKAQFDPFAASTAAGQQVYMRKMVLRRRNGGELIVDGSIGANQVAADVFKGKEFTIGAGGILKTAGSEVILTSQGITVTGVNSSISATALTTGTFAAGNALTVNGNMALNGNMTVQNSGYITSATYRPLGDAAGATGFRLSAAGLDLFSGTVAAGTLVGGTITSPDIRVGANGKITVDASGAIQSNNYSAGSSGWKLSATGFDLPGLTVSAGSIIGDTVSGRNLYVTSGGSISSSNWNGSSIGWSLSSTGFTMYNGTIQGPTVKTDQLYSIATDSTTNQPLFSINSGGYAQFSGARILGNTILGSASAAGYIQSYSYSPGSTGWRVTSSGQAEFNNLSVIGSLSTGPAGTGRVTISDSGYGGAIGFYKSGGGMAGFIYTSATEMFLHPGGNFTKGFRISTTDNNSYGPLNVSGALTVSSGGIEVSGNSKFNNYVTFMGGTTFNGGIDIDTGGISVTGNSNFDNTVTMSTIGGGSSGLTINGTGGVTVQRMTGSAETTASANVYVNSSGTLVKTSSSSRRYKSEIRDAPVEGLVNGILSVRPRIYNYRGLGEQVGIIAEEANDVGLGCFVDWEDGQIENFNYARSATAIIATIQYQQKIITEQSIQIKNIKDEVAELKAMMQQLLDAQN